MEDYADDLNALLEALAIREPVTLCGLSMGGYIAFQFWRKHPERVGQADPLRHASRGRHARGRQGAVGNGGPGTEKEASVASGMLPKLLAPATQQSRPELTAFVREMIEGTHPCGIAAAQRGMAEPPDVASTPRINIPTLVIVGTGAPSPRPRKCKQLRPPSQVRCSSACPRRGISRRWRVQTWSTEQYSGFLSKLSAGSRKRTFDWQASKNRYSELRRNYCRPSSGDSPGPSHPDNSKP